MAKIVEVTELLDGSANMTLDLSPEELQAIVQAGFTTLLKEAIARGIDKPKCDPTTPDTECEGTN